MRFVVLVTLTVLLSACTGRVNLTSRVPTPTQAIVITPTRHVSRDVFAGSVRNDTARHILATFGKPSRTQEFSDGQAIWYYRGLTIDPVTGQVDSMTQVVFDKMSETLIESAVNFYP